MKVSIKTVLLFGVTGLIATLVSTIMFSMYWRSEEILQRLVGDIMENISQFTIDKTEKFLTPAMEAADLVRKLTSDDVIKSSDKQHLATFFYNQLTIYPQFAGIFLGEPDGEFTYVNRNASVVQGGYRTKVIDMATGEKTVTLIYGDHEFKEQERQLDPEDNYDPRKRPWYTSAVAKKGTIWTDPYIFFTSQNPGITAARSAYDANGHFIGVVGIDIEIGELSTFISQLKIGKTGRALIIDDTGTLIAFPDVSQMKLKEEGQKTRLAKITELGDSASKYAFASLVKLTGGYQIESKTFTTFNYQEKDYYAMFRPFKNHEWPWTIGIYIPEDDYLAEIKENQVFNVLIAFGITLVAILLVIWFSTKVVTPLVMLKNESEAIKRLELDSPFLLKTIFSEIQETSDSFSQMKAGLKAFERYVPKKLVRSIISDEKIPDGEIHDLAVLFTDIVNFVSISEATEPNDLVQFLNEYLEEVSTIIKEHDGMIDKYIGDATMAFWGTPFGANDPAFLSCQAALAIQKRVTELNLTWSQQNRPMFQTRVGISYGKVIVGNIGSSERISYTVIGDKVNLANRLEEVNKNYGSTIILDEETYSQIRHRLVARRLDHIQVRGKQEFTTIYELLGNAKCLDPQMIARIAAYEVALQLHFQGQHQEALEHLIQLEDPALLQDMPYQALIKKLEQLV